LIIQEKTKISSINKKAKILIDLSQFFNLILLGTCVLLVGKWYHWYHDHMTIKELKEQYQLSRAAQRIVQDKVLKIEEALNRRTYMSSQGIHDICYTKAEIDLLLKTKQNKSKSKSKNNDI